MNFTDSYELLWNTGLLIALFIAVGFGWYIGFRNGKRPVKQTPLSVVQSYYKGLNYLVGGQPEDAVDTFIDALEVNTETFEIHLALGNFLRGRGEVDRAIRIHQNLLARSGMGQRLRDTAHLELARDYISAGVYDRAERLLKELAEESKELRDLSLKFLLDIYQAEKDWPLAIETADQLRSKAFLFKDRSPEQTYLSSRIAFYHCEIANTLLSEDIEKTKEHLNAAFDADKNSVRASLLSARVCLAESKPELALKYLQRVRQQDKEFIPETLDDLNQVFVYLNDSEWHQKELQQCLSLQPSISTALALVECIEKNSTTAEAAGEQLKDFLQKYPNQRGLLKLIDFELQKNGSESKENLFILQEVLTRLVNERAIYQCQHCGFSGKQLHWLCPSCQQWGMVKRIQGIKGD